MGEIVEAFFNFLIRLDTVVTINMTRLLHTFLDDVRFFLRRPPAVTPGNGICSSPNTQAILTDAAKLDPLSRISDRPFRSKTPLPNLSSSSSINGCDEVFCIKKLFTI
jgi:hypothetical protein